MAHRSRVLGLYRRILRVARTWSATDPQQTATERTYIRDEARKLFKKNKNITEEEELFQHLMEGEARLELGIHYNNPYPRPMNYPQTALPPASQRRRMKNQDTILKQSKSIYVKSLYDKDS